jgi:hypothetical protein
MALSEVSGGTGDYRFSLKFLKLFCNLIIVHKAVIFCVIYIFTFSLCFQTKS